jgi:hypothetical protein
VNGKGLRNHEKDINTIDSLVYGVRPVDSRELIASVLPEGTESWSPVHLRAWTGCDINRVWLVNSVSGSLLKTLISNDLTAVASWGTKYDVTTVVHAPVSPTTTPSSYFEFEQRAGCIPASEVRLYSTNGFNVGRNYRNEPDKNFYPTDLKF